jgi:diguanylate cyclase (GGDEF)-like protein
VEQQSQLRDALRTDRASGVLNRTDLAHQAERVLAEAVADEEPVVLLAVAIEGIRRLDDGRHWELQDWLMQQVGRALRRRLRTDDIIGRFSDDRFVAVLRRLDLSLGELIAKKVLASLQDAIQHGDAPLTDSVNVRCGLAADSHANFEMLLSRACDALQDARDRRVEVAIHESSKRLVGAAMGATS